MKTTIDKNAPGMDAQVDSPKKMYPRSSKKSTPKVLTKPTPKLKRKSAGNSYRGKEGKVNFKRLK